MRTATPSYWLTWRFLVLGSGLLLTAGIAVLVIWKFEGSPNSENQERASKKKRVGDLYRDEAWTPSHKAIHPSWLLAYRLLAFFILLSLLASDVYVNSTDVLFYYTQWTFSLVTLLFGFGSLLSVIGCVQQYRKGVASAKVCCIDEERNDAPTLVKNASLPGVSKGLSSDEETDIREPAGYLGYAFQINFQVCAGAVVLTDCIYWLLIYPFFVSKGQPLPFSGHAMYCQVLNVVQLDVAMHSVNAVALLGEVILNSLQFPFFRFAYFVLYTCTFVTFQWLVHMVASKWWPYPFLDISIKFAILMYLMVGVVHIPCYLLFALVIALKHWLTRLFKWISTKLSRVKQSVQKTPSNK